MKGKNIIIGYQVKKSHDAKSRNKLVDAKFIVSPHPFFAGEIKKANARAGRIQQVLEQKPKSLTSGK